MRSHLLSAIRARWALPAWRSRRGGVAITVALVLVVLIGFVSLGIEMTALLMTSRAMQAAADSAALAAAVAKAEGYPTAYGDEAVALARNAGFVNGVNNATVAVSSPPASGSYAGNAAAVQVVITQVQTLALVALFRSSSYSLTARATALAGHSGGCVLALDGSASGSFLANNSANLFAYSCGIAANSSSSSAITATGSANIYASWLTVVGNFSVSNGSTVTISGTTSTGATAVADPYAARAVPTPQSCFANNAGVVGPSQTLTLPAGTYCGGGINVNNVSNVTLNGLYILKDSSLVVTGGSTLSGTATIVLTGTGTGTNIGSVTVSNNSTINLKAQATGSTAGMVFFQDIRAPAGGTNDFSTAPTVTLNGAVYFPNTTLKFSSGNSTSSACTQLIARMINFFGNTTLNANCTGYGALPIGGGPTSLVE